ncbi:MAG: hypothetical protein KHX46_04095, partial [Clostridiales bacterium]|nr:hypothetical protein [Clostridiales bacterium]
MGTWPKRLAALLCVLALCPAACGAAQADAAEDAAGGGQEEAVWYREGSYAAYRDAHRNAPQPQAEYTVPAASYLPETAEGVGTAALPAYENEQPVVMEEGGSLEWIISVEEAGLYAIQFAYYPLTGKDINIERELRVNGELPFDGSASVLFSRRYAYAQEIHTDASGSDIRPAQYETPDWFVTLAGGSQEYEDDAYLYYFEAGDNVLSLSGGKEALALARIVLTQPQEPPAYAEYLKACQAKGAQPAGGAAVKIQAEAASGRSDQTISMQSDRTSPLTEPLIPGDYAVTQLKINSLGGQNWRYPKQWVEWDVEVEQAGLYRLALRFKQSYLEGTHATRRLYVNGEVPFAEAKTLNFAYGFNWQSEVFGGEDGFYIYLEEGHNTIRLENTVGEIGEIIQTLRGTVEELNTAYRRILMITGSQPDPNRDYNLDKELPACMETFAHQHAVLMALAGRLYEMTGSRGSAYAQLQKAAIQLESFVEDPDSIPFMVQGGGSVAAPGTPTFMVHDDGNEGYAIPIDDWQLGLAAPPGEVPPLEQEGLPELLDSADIDRIREALGYRLHSQLVVGYVARLERLVSEGSGSGGPLSWSSEEGLVTCDPRTSEGQAAGVMEICHGIIAAFHRDQEHLAT